MLRPLLEQTQHGYCIERVTLRSDDLAPSARRINHSSGARESTIAPIHLEVVHAEGDLADLSASQKSQGRLALIAHPRWGNIAAGGLGE
jgi:hypothetical protein